MIDLAKKLAQTEARLAEMTSMRDAALELAAFNLRMAQTAMNERDEYKARRGRTMNDSLEGWTLEHSIETGGFGARLYVKRPREVTMRISELSDARLPDNSLTPKEMANGLLREVTDTALKLMLVQAAELDPKTKLEATCVEGQFREAFSRVGRGLTSIYTERIPNGYEKLTEYLKLLADTAAKR